MGSQNLWPWNNPAGLREAAEPNDAYNTNTAVTATTLTAAEMTGGFVGVTLNLTGTLTAAANATTDTAANIVAAIPQAQRYVGFTYKLRVINSSSGAFAWTVVGGTGVTVTGTATVAQNTWREFVVTLGASLTAVTLQNVGTGTYS
jgi:hypothetical protein